MLALVALALTVGTSAVVAVLGPGSHPGSVGSGAQHRRVALDAVQIRGFSGPFAPAQVFSVGGDLWFVGSSSSGVFPERCAMEELSPDGQGGPPVQIPACPIYAAVGGADIYFAASTHADAADTDTFHIEAFDTATGNATLFAPVVAVTSGTGYAHMTMAYGDGSLWLEPWTTDILQISPSTGAVIGRVGDIPESNTGHPSVVLTGDTLWAAGGTVRVLRIVPGSNQVSSVFTSPSTGSVIWLSSGGGRVWADEVEFLRGGRGRPVSRLLGFSGSGKKVADRAAPEISLTPVLASGGRMWAVLEPCMSAEKVWDLDPATGAALASITLPADQDGCDVAGEQAATIGSALYVLQPQVSVSGGAALFRISVRS